MDLKDLYRDVIVDHNRNPRNFGKLDPADAHAEGFNPLCGDRLDLYLTLDGTPGGPPESQRIRDVRFEGKGCAISVASASLMTETLKGRTLAEVKHYFDDMHALLTTENFKPTLPLGKLAALSGVREFPMRVKCATLSWHTLNAALARQQTPVSTEGSAT